MSKNMIPLVDLKRQHDDLKKEIDRAISEVINSSAFVFGNELDNFEKDFASFCQNKYCLGVGNGADALRLAVLALGIGKGDEVISVANTFTASIDCAIFAGAKPILVDCDKHFNIDVSQIESKITKKTKAIIPVHLFGQSCQMDTIQKIAKKYNLFIIEDCAQAHGAKYLNKRVGTFGNVSCYSFFPGKNLGAMGDGGAVLTDNVKTYNKLKQLRYFGQGKDRYHHDTVGYNSRLDNLQAAILRIKLRKLDRWNNERRKAANLYTKLLKDIVETPKELKGAYHVYHMYVIKTEKRDQLQKYLEKNNIATGIHYPIPLHLQKCHKGLGYKKGDFPVSEDNSQKMLSLPIFPGIKDSEIQYISNKIKSFFKK